MTLRLTVDHEPWDAHVRGLAAAVDGLVPVVKGNGYGFGRAALAAVAAALVDRVGADIAVGTVFEAADLPSSSTAVVLAPHLGALPSSLPPTAVLCAGAAHHVRALADAGWVGRVHLKVRSSMHRYGVDVGGIAGLVALAAGAGMEIAGFTVHLPLAGDDDERIAEVTRVLPACDPILPLSVSHLSAASFARLQARHPDRSFRLRLGTALWHGDKAALRLSADVVDVRTVRDGEHAGYRHELVTVSGSLVLVGAGSSHGVVPLTDGRSPLHFSHRRMALLEPPHMHTTMALVPVGQPCPVPGDWVDVQRPLTTVAVDEVVRR